jgi:hypothetical protein
MPTILLAIGDEALATALRARIEPPVLLSCRCIGRSPS